jgi:hypothetical protein
MKKQILKLSLLIGTAVPMCAYGQKEILTQKEMELVLENQDIHYMLRNNPQSLDYGFSKFEKSNDDFIDGFHIVTADDGNFRVYETVLHGHSSLAYNYCAQYRLSKNTEVFMQYNLPNKAFIFEKETNSSFPVKKIFSVPIQDKTYYLCLLERWYGFQGGFGINQKIVAYSISKDRVVAVPLFKVKNGNLLKEIEWQYSLEESGYKIENKDGSYDFDDFDEDLYNKDADLLSNTSIKYDKNEKKLYIPLIAEGVVTHKNLIYQWSGKYFTYKGIE